ncbi:ArsR family transcriptional regulator [Streptomyces sp. NPDC001941]|uniref:helix-turn-helix transcriptional regulator n=1 Tax=Streptomyces sp. NPDC001941 TaxID=3154659 RepID=UPI0033278BC5
MTEMPAQADPADDLHRALAVPSRRRLMSQLREADGPLGVDELAAGAGLSVATVRHHLAVLAEAGLVRATTTAGPGRGRPRLRYAAARGTADEDARAADAAYRDLAAVLVDAVTTAGADARTAGRQWGRTLAAQDPDASPADRVLAHATRMGFGPEQAPHRPDGGRRLLLHACPYRALARARPDVVCAVHQGVLDGLLDGTGSAAVLTPFAAPDLCRADIHPGGAPVRLTRPDPVQPR